MFRQGKIGFLDIADKVEAVLEKTPHYDNYTFEDILEIDKFAREIGG